MAERKVGNLLALAVLSYLTQRPMHPYELGRTLREHGDERSIKFNHGSLYMVVGQLAKAGLIAEQETVREGQRPERTVYALTDAGREEFHEWLRELLAEPRHEYPQFVAALSLVAALPPDEVVELLATRRAGSPSSGPNPPRSSSARWRPACIRSSSSRRSTGSRCSTPRRRSSTTSSPASPTPRPDGARSGPPSSKQGEP